MASFALLSDFTAYAVVFGVTPGLPGAGRGIYLAIRHWKPSTGLPFGVAGYAATGNIALRRQFGKEVRIIQGNAGLPPRSGR